MRHDRTVRNLNHLEHSASTARVLNLNAVAKRMALNPEYRLRPLFRNPLLNRSIIMKHRLRYNEHELFADYRLLATKVVMPIDPGNLSVGAHYFFIGQKSYAGAIEDLLGPEAQIGPHDRMVLQILDETPTLDPFVVREQLRRNGLEPSPYYFDVSPGDLSRMFAFVHREIAPLANLSGEGRATFENRAAKLARKLLSSSADTETEPLRQTLKLELNDYREGVFSWKGFLYYKWCLEELGPHIDRVVQEIGQVKLRGPVRAEMRSAIDADRGWLSLAVAAAREGIKATITIYDCAYRELVDHKDPTSFRAFLLDAPALFFKLGEALGAIQHVVSYWRYRFPQGARTVVDPVEMNDMLQDFLNGLQAFDVEPVPENDKSFDKALLL